jgi:cell division septal protein FtsQ
MIRIIRSARKDLRRSLRLLLDDIRNRRLSPRARADALAYLFWLFWAFVVCVVFIGVFVWAVVMIIEGLWSAARGAI